MDLFEGFEAAGVRQREIDEGDVEQLSSSLVSASPRVVTWVIEKAP